MAGSYSRATTPNGRLRNQTLPDAIRTPLDVYEMAEEMYGMIWYLADQLHYFTSGDPAVWVEEARANYIRGIQESPGIEQV